MEQLDLAVQVERLESLVAYLAARCKSALRDSEKRAMVGENTLRGELRLAILAAQDAGLDMHTMAMKPVLTYRDFNAVQSLELEALYKASTID